LPLAMGARKIDPADDARDEVVPVSQRQGPIVFPQVVLRLNDNRPINARATEVRLKIGGQEIAADRLQRGRFQPVIFERLAELPEVLVRVDDEWHGKSRGRNTQGSIHAHADGQQDIGVSLLLAGLNGEHVVGTAYGVVELPFFERFERNTEPG
jgi:hypothetical protein